MKTELSELQLELSRIALEISGRLERLQSGRIVFAESCTAGLIAATLGGVPGISRYLCGSAVTYREATKTEWLGVPVELIREQTAESSAVSQELARRVLQSTPEATVSLAITGHLGPGANETVDGVVFLAVCHRGQVRMDPDGGGIFRLQFRDRIGRQCEAALLALRCLNRVLEQLEAGGSAG